MAVLTLPMLALTLRADIAVLLRQGVSIRGIARQLSYLRQSIRRYIRMQKSSIDNSAEYFCQINVAEVYFLHCIRQGKLAEVFNL